MKPYRNVSGDSGIVGYEVGRNYIRIRFKSNDDYTYEAGRVGRCHLTEMQKRAEAGRGLATYINAHSEVRDGFSRRIGRGEASKG